MENLQTDSFQYELEPELSVAEFVDVLKRSTLAERRPVHDEDRIAQMLEHADLILTARSTSGLLVGVARAITDFSYCCYLSDLAVDVKYQGQGIGRGLLHRIRDAAGVHAKLILLAAPAARTYYPHIGLTAHESCWTLG